LTAAGFDCAAAWLAEIERVPLEARVEARSIYAMIAGAAARTPDATAFALVPDGDPDGEPEHRSYAELLSGVNRAANLFHEIAGPGAVVALLLPNVFPSHLAFWGAETVGVGFPINHFLTAEGIAALIGRAKATVLVAPGSRLDADTAAKVPAVARLAPGLKHIFRIGDGEPWPCAADDFMAALAARPDHAPPHALDDQRTVDAAYFCTGGTTGLPKIVRQSHWNQIANSWMFAESYRLRPGATSLCGIPLFHVPGAFLGGLSAFAFGATVVQLTARGYRHPNVLPNFWRLVARYRPSVLGAVPTVIATLAEQPVAGNDISSVESLVVSAAAMPGPLLRAFEEKVGLRILEAYGQTECTSSIASTPAHCPRKIGSVGVRKPFMDLRVARLDEGGRFERWCAADEIGTVLCKGPNVTPGYLEPSHNEALWVADGWLNSGDMGRLDADGYLWLTGRQKDLIKRGGHGIDPRVIEETLSQHPAVALCAAIGKPDSRLGEVPVAYVTLKPSHEVDAAELIDFCRELIAERAAVPKEIVVIERMPLTGVGKIFKPELRRHAIARVLEEQLGERFGAAAGLRVTVRPDDRWGTVARITLPIGKAELRGEVEALVGRFAVRCEVSDTD
jgi:fatty-acyl-CoA synthase